MHYVIQAWYRFGRTAKDVPANGPLREGRTGRIVCYATREEAQAWIDDAGAMAHPLREGETGRPLYTVREAEPGLDAMLDRHPLFHARAAAAEVEAWDRDDVRVLLAALVRLRTACDEAVRMGQAADPEDYVDMDALPSQEFPQGLDAHHVWALDRKGMALAGAAADRIVSAAELMDPPARRNARVYRRSASHGWAPVPPPSVRSGDPHS